MSLFDEADELKQYKQLEREYPRAFKLMLEKKNFIVIASHEPYFIEAYQLIRDNEMRNGTWTTQDESFFQHAIQKHLHRNDSVMIRNSSKDSNL